jgi:peptidoglycan/xylan/chitin deacetylase (PgdA/CDA1 family)
MSIHHHLLSAAYRPIRFAKTVAGFFGRTEADRLRVLLYHDIAPADQAQFAAQLRWLAREWTFASPERFAAMMSGAEPVRGSNLLLTFDDGFASNRKVAEEILGPMGIRALFFVVSDFVDLTDGRVARDFVSRNIQPGNPLERISPHLRNMTWSDLESLLEQGHMIGAHTRTHARLSQVAESGLESEIVSCGDTLERRLGVPIEHFAYTFGDLASFGAKPFAIARSRYRFIYSGLRGDNAGKISPFALRRDAISAQDAPALLGAFLEGAADFRYARSRAVLDSWV